MRIFSFILAVLTASVPAPYQQWIQVKETAQSVTRIWLQPRPDKSPAYFKFIYRTIQQPVTTSSNFHDFLGWLDCDTRNYLIEVSGATSNGQLLYIEKRDTIPFYNEPDQIMVDHLFSIACN